MNLKFMSLGMLFVTTISASALAKPHEGPFEKLWYSAKMREGIKGRGEFELKVASGHHRLFRHRDEVKIKVKPLDRHDRSTDGDRRDFDDERLCFKLEVKGHGQLFQDLKDDLEQQFDDGNELVEELHHVRVRRHSVEAVICDLADGHDSVDEDVEKVDLVDRPALDRAGGRVDNEKDKTKIETTEKYEKSGHGSKEKEKSVEKSVEKSDRHDDQGED